MKGEPWADKSITPECHKLLLAVDHYGNHQNMSRARIYELLTSECGSNASHEAAEFAIEYMEIDYKRNAFWLAATCNIEDHMSKAAIYTFLTSGMLTKFTSEEALYALEHIRADYKLNALKKAQIYKESMGLPLDEIYKRLTSPSGYNGQFTEEEANYAIAHLE